MKTIDSLGGPFLLIDRTIAESWAGCDGVSFFPIECGPSDYECLIEHYVGKKRNMTAIKGLSQSAMLINMPLPTALVTATSSLVIFAQVDYADDDWSLDVLSGKDFSHLTYTEPFSVEFSGLDYVLFDAVRSWKDVGSELLSFELPPGKMECSDAEWKIDDATSVVICRLQRSV